jgi:hypothetical protein
MKVREIESDLDLEVSNAVDNLIKVALSEKREDELEFDAMTRYEEYAGKYTMLLHKIGVKDNTPEFYEAFYKLSQWFYNYKMVHFYKQVKYRS